MTRFNRFAIATVTTATLLAGFVAPAYASMAPFTFSDIEYGAGGDMAAQIGKTDIARAIPIGMATVTATSLLEAAGARCHNEGDAVRCTRNSFEAVENVLHDVAWQVDLQSANGVVTSTSADRISFGS